MFKVSSKILLMCSLLAAQSNFVHVGAGAIGPSERGIIAGAISIGFIGVGVGVAGVFGLMKTYQWAKQEQGPKKYIGRGILVTAGAATFFGFGYGIAKLS
ncbi:MAG: hypothetical protein WC707_05360 [Candidatus Babeliaceae bacterium]|jgi:hypothetical protein